MFKVTKKKVAAVAVAASAVFATGVAYSFWTAGGGGSGTATIGHDSGVTINPVKFGHVDGEDFVDETLYPGHDVTVTFTINNSSADTDVKVGKVIADTTGDDDGDWVNGISGLPDGCSAADFSFEDVDVNASIAASDSITRTGTLHMENTGDNQDACQDANPVLHLTVDNSGLAS